MFKYKYEVLVFKEKETLILETKTDNGKCSSDISAYTLHTYLFQVHFT